MATTRWSLNPGKADKDIVVAAGQPTVTAAVELTIDRAVVTKKSEAMRCVMEIYQHLKRSNY